MVGPGKNWVLIRGGIGLDHREIILKQGVNTLGRHSNCDIHLVSSTISRRHCNLVLTADSKVMITNLSPDGNGAFINGEMVKKDTVLLENDLISFGCRGLNIYNATDEFLYKLSYVENSTDMTEIVSNDENEVPDLKQNKTHIRILTARLLKVYNQTAAIMKEVKVIPRIDKTLDDDDVLIVEDQSSTSSNYRTQNTSTHKETSKKQSNNVLDDVIVEKPSTSSKHLVEIKSPRKQTSSKSLSKTLPPEEPSTSSKSISEEIITPQRLSTCTLFKSLPKKTISRDKPSGSSKSMQKTQQGKSSISSKSLTQKSSPQKQSIDNSTDQLTYELRVVLSRLTESEYKENKAAYSRERAISSDSDSSDSSADELQKIANGDDDFMTGGNKFSEFNYAPSPKLPIDASSKSLLEKRFLRSSIDGRSALKSLDKASPGRSVKSLTPKRRRRSPALSTDFTSSSSIATSSRGSSIENRNNSSESSSYSSSYKLCLRSSVDVRQKSKIDVKSPLPSVLKKFNATKNIQKKLKSICDPEDGDSNEVQKKKHKNKRNKREKRKRSISEELPTPSTTSDDALESSCTCNNEESFTKCGSAKKQKLDDEPAKRFPPRKAIRASVQLREDDPLRICILNASASMPFSSRIPLAEPSTSKSVAPQVEKPQPSSSGSSGETPLPEIDSFFNASNKNIPFVKYRRLGLRSKTCDEREVSPDIESNEISSNNPSSVTGIQQVGVSKHRTRSHSVSEREPLKITVTKNKSSTRNGVSYQIKPPEATTERRQIKTMNALPLYKGRGRNPETGFVAESTSVSHNEPVVIRRERRKSITIEKIFNLHKNMHTLISNVKQKTESAIERQTSRKEKLQELALAQQQQKEAQKQQQSEAQQQKEAPQISIPDNTVPPISKPVYGVKLTEKSRSIFLMDATPAPIINRRTSISLSSMNRRSSVNCRAKEVSVAPSNPIQATDLEKLPTIETSPIAELPANTPITSSSPDSDFNPSQMTLNYYTERSPDYVAEREYLPTKLSLNGPTGGIGLKTFVRRAHKEKHSTFPIMQQNANKMELPRIQRTNYQEYRNLASNVIQTFTSVKSINPDHRVIPGTHAGNRPDYSHRAKVAMQQPVASTSTAHHWSYVKNDKLRENPKPLKSILKPVNRIGVTKIKPNQKFHINEEKNIIYQLPWIEPEQSGVRQQREANMAIRPFVDQRIEDDFFPIVIKNCIALVGSKILPLLQKSENIKTDLNYFGIWNFKSISKNDYRVHLESTMKEEFSERLLTIYKENKSTKWENAIITSNQYQKRRNDQYDDETIACLVEYEVNKVRAGYLTILKWKVSIDNQDDFRYLIAYVKDVFNPDIQKPGSKHFSTVILYSSQKFPSFKNADIVSLKHLDYIRADLKPLQLIDRLFEEDHPLLDHLLTPDQIQQLSPAQGRLEYTGKDDLNNAQLSIVVNHALNFDIERENAQITVIEGGPGTGKSRVIKNIVVETLKARARRLKSDDRIRHDDSSPYRILVCTKSNTACDEITEKLIDAQVESNAKFEVVRLGVISRMSPIVQKHTLSEKLKAMHNSGEFNVPMNRQRRLSMHEKILDRCQVVTSTINSSFNSDYMYRPYDVVIIDEATQCSEVDLLIPLYFKPKKLVLIGDSKQLGFKFQSAALQRHNKYDNSLMERIIKTFSDVNDRTIVPVYTLNVQYRMHMGIFMFPREEFYNDKIETADCVSGRKFPLNYYGIFSLQNCQNLTQNMPQNTYNLEDIEFIMELLQKIENIVHRSEYTIGVITPYLRQKTEIIDTFRKRKFRLHSVSFDTVDATPSTEKDIIILSTAKTDGKSFICDPKRLNVALTRARHSLWICGNFDSFQNDSLWNRLTSNASKRGLLHEISNDDIGRVEGIIKNEQF